MIKSSIFAIEVVQILFRLPNRSLRQIRPQKVWLLDKIWLQILKYKKERLQKDEANDQYFILTDCQWQYQLNLGEKSKNVDSQLKLG